jgi:hypothetical protein
VGAVGRNGTVMAAAVVAVPTVGRVRAPLAAPTDSLGIMVRVGLRACCHEHRHPF